ncbi:MAG TPA: histidine kinase [Casimicrobiaceae bacterium]|nr:histidine kinase [Casimicrobiaceae bacterium]
MSTDQPTPGAASAAAGTPPPLQPPGIKQTLGDVWRVIVELWWRFFDWLAVVSWKTLLVVYLLCLILAAMLHRPMTFIFFVIVSAIIKVVAGGKRRAELTARQATQRAEDEQLERRVLEARMQALQAQIEPHFLFNTLGSIDQLIQTDPPRASKMQQSLIRYLRSAMPQMREGARPTLGQQVDLCRAFLDIMAVRMEERLQTVINVPEGLKSAVFPSMMLQTLVENAIKHGLEPRATGGQITITAEIVDGQLTVHVLDNGVGFMPKGDDGVGLANIRERLKALYSGRAELIIGVPAAGGTCATIKVPYEVAPVTA